METRQIKTADGTIIHYWNGKIHNWEGAAVIPQGKLSQSEYYLFGIKYSKEQWQEAKKDVNGEPFEHTSVGKASGARF